MGPNSTHAFEEIRQNIAQELLSSLQCGNDLEFEAVSTARPDDALSAAMSQGQLPAVNRVLVVRGVGHRCLD